MRNTSSHTMRYLGDGNFAPRNTPIEILRPGDTDRLVYKADGSFMTIRPDYLVEGTGYLVNPVFSVPLIGSNASACGVNSAKSPVGVKCDIGSGWEPDAHLTFVNR